MQAIIDRPRFRTDLVAEPIEEGGHRYIDVVDPEWPRQACMKMLQHFPDHRATVDAMQH